MMMTSPLWDDAVVIIQLAGGLPDPDGLPTQGRTETPWAPVNVQQVAADETTDGHQQATATSWRVAGPPVPVEVRAGDLIRWNGTEYAVDGNPDTRRGRFRLEHTSLEMVKRRA